MSALETLLVTAATLEQLEATLTVSEERDIKSAVRLARLEVERLLEEEVETPGRHELLTS